MVERERILERVRNALGFSCLAAALLLTSPGVTIVRADESAKPSKLGAENSVIQPANQKAPTRPVPRAGDPAPQAEQGAIVLNTRGYNYGPDRPIADPTAPAPRTEKLE